MIALGVLAWAFLEIAALGWLFYREHLRDKRDEAARRERIKAKAQLARLEEIARLPTWEPHR